MGEKADVIFLNFGAAQFDRQMLHIIVVARNVERQAVGMAKKKKFIAAFSSQSYFFFRG